MKRLITISLGLIAYTSFGQAGASIVTDPGSYGYLAQNIAVATEQATALEKQLTLLDKARKALEKVNSSIQSMNMLARIIENETNMIKVMKSTYSNMEQSKLFTPRELANMLSSFNDIVARSKQLIQTASNVASEGIFEMNDSERLKWLTETYDKSCQTTNDTKVLSDKYERLRQKKLLLQTYGGQ